jgi:hypothetical protein
LRASLSGMSEGQAQSWVNDPLEGKGGGLLECFSINEVSAVACCAMGPGRVPGGTDQSLCTLRWCLAIRSTRLVLGNITATFGIDLANKRNISDHITRLHPLFSSFHSLTLSAQRSSKRSAIPHLSGRTQPTQRHTIPYNTALYLIRTHICLHHAIMPPTETCKPYHSTRDYEKLRTHLSRLRQMSES